MSDSLRKLIRRLVEDSPDPYSDSMVLAKAALEAGLMNTGKMNTHEENTIRLIRQLLTALDKDV